MLTVASIISAAQQIAKCSGYDTQALNLFNAILMGLCNDVDSSLSREVYNFDFNPGLTTNFGSGPYNLPVDYLRASGSSGEGQKTFFWTLDGVPHLMIPCDLSEFDMQVQNAGRSSYPLLWATDMANTSVSSSSRYKAMTTIATTINNVTATLASATGVAIGDGIAGEGIGPCTRLNNLVGVTATLSIAAAATLTAGSVIIGMPPQAYAYPPPSGAYPVTIRYQKMMPPIVNTANYPWFPDDGYLIEELAGRLMEITDDARATEFLGNGQMPGRAGRRLRLFLQNDNDKKNRPQQVELDRRNFRFPRRLRDTKQIWG